MGFHETLIAQVQSYRALYDEKDKNYNNHQRKEEIWQIISQEIGETTEFCKLAWRKLRDSYRKTRIARTIKTRQGMKINRRVKFGKELTFLNPHLRVELNASDPYDENERTVDSTKSVSSFQTSSLRSSGLNRTREYVQQPPVQEYLPFNYEPPVTQQSSVDPLEAFFSSIVATVKTFPPSLQLTTKQKIFQIVTDAEASLINPAPLEVISDQSLILSSEIHLKPE
ncbi:uncharacterized protein LOC115887500 isoform X3 [Sitophilus oryzae]|uniref:Uncharacterized protein LOC115887500 isoform X3 n=1 Tax=Sitophilus oryzae TaxID=7048 RepID=A0A6J2YHS6_SITOR|nr:uncharacterized protein LOC115887500 isoform X3 [Sitophilus oryzae]